jgi:hypothetical protein
MKTNKYKIMNIKNILGLLLLSIIAISCEDYLKEDPPTFISTTNFYKTASDARTACDGIYENFSDGSSNSTYGRFWPVIDLGTDDVTSRTQGNLYNDFLTHTVSSTNSWFENFGQFSNFWIGIARANNVIAYVPQIEMNGDEKNNIIGEARALRALYYYHLVRAYGDMPLVTDAVTTEADFNKPRSSLDDIYNQIIIPDLQYAETVCKDVLHSGRITKWTAKVILADVYLNRAGWRRTSQGDLVQGDASNWALARDKAKEIIDNSPHSLNVTPVANGQNITPAYGVAWLESAPFTKESMFELAAVPIEGFGSWLSRECSPAPFGTGYWGASAGVRPFVAQGNTDRIIDMRFPGRPPAQGGFIPTPDLYNAFENGDERRDWSLLTKYITPGGKTYLSQPTFRKYVDINYFIGDEGTSFRNTNNNFIVYRFADALLIYAEAANEAEGSPSNAAYDALNRIRRRAGLADVNSLSSGAFRELVANERRCEFNAECKRKFDLIRTNQLLPQTANITLTWTAQQNSATDYSNSFTQFTGTQVWPENEWLFPIPQSEIELNQANDWIQNIGY